MVRLVLFDILQLPHTIISNSEKLTHPTVHKSVEAFRMWFVTRVGFGGPKWGRKLHSHTLVVASPQLPLVKTLEN